MRSAPTVAFERLEYVLQGAVTSAVLLSPCADDRGGPVDAVQVLPPVRRLGQSFTCLRAQHTRTWVICADVETHGMGGVERALQRLEQAEGVLLTSEDWGASDTAAISAYFEGGEVGQAWANVVVVARSLWTQADRVLRLIAYVHDLAPLHELLQDPAVGRGAAGA